ncbi:MAG TPA: hypothetical protein VF824_16460 [Thermoanaerobaculia bacterium]|jgi:hypothetical protein
MARAERTTLGALFAVFTLAAIAPLRSYDLFWHLATGRWIVEHRALPLHDPFAVASDRVPWINGEWLFEVLLHPLHALVGLHGLSIVRGVLAAAIFALAFRFSREESPLVAAVAFAGAMATFDLRPSSVALLFVVLALHARMPLAHFVIALLWINIHPSALLAPLIAWCVTRRIAPTAASAVALLCNPFGWRAIAAPIALTRFVGSGAFVNAEWLPSAPAIFPLLYFALLLAIVAVVTDKQRDWWRIALLALFAFLAIRHVRNQGLFFAALPMLVRLPRMARAVALTTSAAVIAFVAIIADHHTGISRRRFPIDAVARLHASRLRGNIYNPDQFGGLLIYAFYPQRRALTDGRNELYRTFIPEYARARGDERAWRALLRKYRIDVAIDERRPPLEVVDALTGRKRMMDASLAYWPRKEWVLLYEDEVAIVVARRSALSSPSR